MTKRCQRGYKTMTVDILLPGAEPHPQEAPVLLQKHAAKQSCYNQAGRKVIHRSVHLGR